MGNLEEFPAVEVKKARSLIKGDKIDSINYVIENISSDEKMKVFDISINIFVNDKKLDLADSSEKDLAYSEKDPVDFSDSIQGKIVILSGGCQGKELELKHERARIGRVNPKDPYAHNSSDIVFPMEPDYRFISRISKPHAEILCQDGKYFLIHAPNKNVINQTLLNGKELRQCEMNPLKKGDVITVADADLRFL